MSKPGRSLIDHYENGEYAHFLQSRASLPLGVEGIFVDQPAGHYPHFPSDEIWISVQKSGYGKALLDLGAGRFTTMLRPGDILVRTSGAEGIYSIFHQHSFALISIPMSSAIKQLILELDLSTSDMVGNSSRILKSDIIKGLVLGLTHIQPADHSVPTIAAESAVTLILAELGRLKRCSPEVGHAVGGLPPVKQARVLDFMHSNLHRDIGLEDLAASAGLDRFHFVRVFKESFGMSPYQYLSRIRVETACQLLKTTKLSVGEISMRTGLGSRENLHRALIKHVGASARRYRENA